MPASYRSALLHSTRSTSLNPLKWLLHVNGFLVEEPRWRQLSPSHRGRFLAQKKRFGMTVFFRPAAIKSASSATLMLPPTTLVRRAKLSERQPGNSLTVSLQGVTAFDPNTLLIPCSSSLKAWKDGRKSVHDKHLNRKFPLFTAPFPAGGAKSCDYGQDLQKSWLATEKFAAKFPAPGNLKRADSRILLVGIHK
jgi:hypothetical protein